MAIEIKSPGEVERMRAAGLVVAEVLAELRAAVAPGVSTAELDAVADRGIRDRGAVPSFKGYHGFPASICASVNDEVVHGIPGRRVLAEGDVVSLDCGAILAGWHGDAAVTVPVGEVPAEVSGLLRVTEDALWAGVAAMRAGGWLRDIGSAVQDAVERAGAYGIVEDYTGHGIGTAMHQDPHVPNFRTRARGPRLRPGLVLAVEPMVTLGSPDTVLLDDGWTVRTADGSPAAHAEHTVAVTPEGPWVLTALDGGAQRLRDLGVAARAVS